MAKKWTDHEISTSKGNDMDKKSNSLRIKFPDGIGFKDLDLKRDRLTGAISFNLGVFAQICQKSGLSLEHFYRKNGNGSKPTDFLITWYNSHLEKGGERDQVMDGLIEEGNNG